MTLRLFLSTCLFFGAIGIAAAGIPKIAEIPASLPPSVREPLVKRWAALDAKRGSIKRRVDAHNDHCGAIEETSDQAAVCQSEQRALEGEREDYAQEVAALNSDTQKAIADNPPSSAPSPVAPSLPVIDPAQLVPAELVTYNQSQLAALTKRKAMLERILKRLQTLREQESSYATDIGKMQDEIFVDALTDALTGLSTPVVLRSVLRVSPLRALEVARVFKNFKTGVTAVAAVEALSGSAGGESQDAKRSLDKLHALSQVALEAVAGMTDLPLEQRDMLKRTVRFSYASVKALQEQDNAMGASTRTQLVTCLDGLLSMGAAVYTPLRVARASVNASLGAYAYFQLDADKEAIRDALVSTQQGRLTIMRRLEQTDELITFYQTELKKVGQAGNPPAARGTK
jgi:hypothetical protein